jgi:hypothetical protein
MLTSCAPCVARDEMVRRAGHHIALVPYLLLVVALVWGVALGDGLQDTLGTHERVLFWGDADTKGSSSASGVQVSSFKGATISLDTLIDQHKVNFYGSTSPLPLSYQ